MTATTANGFRSPPMRASFAMYQACTTSSAWMRRSVAMYSIIRAAPEPRFVMCSAPLLLPLLRSRRLSPSAFTYASAEPYSRGSPPVATTTAAVFFPISPDRSCTEPSSFVRSVRLQEDLQRHGLEGEDLRELGPVSRRECLEAVPPPQVILLEHTRPSNRGIELPLPLRPDRPGVTTRGDSHHPGAASPRSRPTWHRASSGSRRTLPPRRGFASG